MSVAKDNISGEEIIGEESEISPESLPDKCQSLRLRSIHKRIETEKNRHLPKQRKSRERPAPLSKYRRKTANARERQRMQEVNNAFERLKESIPHHKLNAVEEKKDTKITTLRCAITYINSLSGLLTDINKGRDVSPEYYFTDRQLGLDNGTESAAKRRPKAKKGKGKKKSKSKSKTRDKKKRVNTSAREKNGSSKVIKKATSASAAVGAIFSQKAPIAKLISGLGKVNPNAVASIQLPQVPVEPAQLLKGPLTIVDNSETVKRSTKHEPNQHLLAFSTIPPSTQRPSTALISQHSHLQPPPAQYSNSIAEHFVQNHQHSEFHHNQQILQDTFSNWTRDSEALIIEEISDLTPLTGVDCFVSGPIAGNNDSGLSNGIESNCRTAIETSGHILNVQDLFISLEPQVHTNNCESMEIQNQSDQRKEI